MSAITKEQVEQFLLGKVAELTGKPELKETMAPTERLSEVGIDSVMFVNLIIQIEQHFDMFFEDNELMADQFQNIEQFTTRILKKLGVPL
jgi:acyl carrier protein